MHDTENVRDPERCFPLAPEDFARVNPNTGTAPVFRTRRDAEITRGIYERHPVLVDHSGRVTSAETWPGRVYKQGLFNMTSDSHLFRTAAQLDARASILLRAIVGRGVRSCIPAAVPGSDDRAVRSSGQLGLESTQRTCI